MSSDSRNRKKGQVNVQGAGQMFRTMNKSSFGHVFTYCHANLESIEIDGQNIFFLIFSIQHIVFEFHPIEPEGVVQSREREREKNDNQYLLLQIRRRLAYTRSTPPSEDATPRTGGVKMVVY